MKPRIAKTIPKIFVAKTFIKANFISPLRNKLTVSNENDEKVVKEPNIPIKIKDFMSADNIVFSLIPHKKPIIKEPKRLTARVPQGNATPNTLCEKPEIPYLKTAPIAPPNATYKNLININPT